MAECLTPFGVRNKITNDTIPVPCGKCPECYKRRVSGWSFRLLQEDKVSISSHFITLTYDTKNVPVSRNGFMQLDKKSLQLFFKRLRKAMDRDNNNSANVGVRSNSNNNKPRIKYYAVGEYGGRTWRPHYHIILFNAKIELIQEAWNLGHVHYGVVNGASVGYTLKYMMKKPRIPQHRNDDRQPEFALMSKGLGESYITDNMVRWHHADKNERMYCVVDGTKKIAMPRYYKDRIYTKQERKQVGYHARQKVVKKERELQKRDGDMYYTKKAENAKAAFRKMEKAANLNRNKI